MKDHEEDQAKENVVSKKMRIGSIMTSRKLKLKFEKKILVWYVKMKLIFLVINVLRDLK